MAAHGVGGAAVEIEAQLNDLFDRATALITALDLMEIDCDLEDGADAEPSVGWGERGPRGPVAWQVDKRGSMDDDRELEDEHGGDINDEPQEDAGDMPEILEYAD
ncbi:MAG: hypothetical protein EOR60_15125 [Mesorhizobium sp.]|jgi:hypothetical protein|nr:MAG: hypothetical protein EOR60_15125 [Mesorhizobium sp.]